MKEGERARSAGKRRRGSRFPYGVDDDLWKYRVRFMLGNIRTLVDVEPDWFRDEWLRLGLTLTIAPAGRVTIVEKKMQSCEDLSDVGC